MKNRIPEEVYRFFKNNHKCIGCGNCCHCTPMMITGKDIKVMACNLSLTTKEFKKQYTKQYPNVIGLSHFKQENPCTFFDNINKKCKIYDARPDTCRKYPFNNKKTLPDNCIQITNLFHELVDKNGQINKESLLYAIQKRGNK